MGRNTKVPEGFSGEKGSPNYFLDAVRDMWNELDIDVDTEEVRWIINWFDDRRTEIKLKDLYIDPSAIELMRNWPGNK